MMAILINKNIFYLVYLLINLQFVSRKTLIKSDDLINPLYYPQALVLLMF